jgi:hypothetical protein
VVQGATHFHQKLDRLGKSGYGLTGFLEGSNVFYAPFTVPFHLPNGAWKIYSVKLQRLCQ